MKDTEPKQESLPQRLCGEIQLFDLCDLASCRLKTGRFCGNAELLERFEKIADQELRSPERFVEEELDDDYEEDDETFDDYDGDEEGDWDEKK